MPVVFLYGQQTKVELISMTHGAIRIPLAQTFDYSPAFDERRIYEFDNPELVAVVTNFNGVEVRFDHYDSDSKLVDAMVNDLDPAGVANLDDPTLYEPVNILVNVKSKLTSKIVQSVLCKAVTLSGAAAAQPVREEGTIARSGIGINVYRVKGAAIEYARALRASSTAFAQGAANSEVDKVATLDGLVYKVVLTNEAQNVVANDLTIDGTSLIMVLKNGNQYTGASVVTALGVSTVSIPAVDFDANDVFEIFSTYLDA